jgi:hypothetical protein
MTNTATSESIRRSWRDPEIRMRRIAGLKKAWENPEIRAKWMNSHVGVKRNSGPAISRALTGRTLSEETKQKIKLAHIGKKRIFSAEHRANLSKALRGDPKLHGARILGTMTWRKNSHGECGLCHRMGPRVRDHDHSPGGARGWLCPSCNPMLGWYERLTREGITHEHIEAWIRRGS